VITESERQSIIDAEHLKMLSVGYWVWGGLMAVYSVFIGAYFGFIGFIIMSVPTGPDAPPDFFRWVFPIIGTFAFLIAGSLAGLQIANGFWIRNRTHRVFSLVIAGLVCFSIPVGTLLGVASFLTLLRPSVAALYERTSFPPAPPAPPVDVPEP